MTESEGTLFRNMQRKTLQQVATRGVIRMGDDRVDPVLLAGAWYGRRRCERQTCRSLADSAGILVPLDTPEDLKLTLRVRGVTMLHVAVNDVHVATLPLLATLRDHEVFVAAYGWRKGVNVLKLSVEADGRAGIERVVLERVEGAL